MDNMLNKGIEYTIEVSDLDVNCIYTATLFNAATKKSYSVTGFFFGDKCYFYYPSTYTITFDVGLYQLNVYDSGKREMFYNNAFCKVRDAYWLKELI